MIESRPLHRLNASAIAHMVASGELAVDEITRQTLARIRELDASIHAWIYLEPDGVLAEAATLHAEARAGNLRGPLHGVPVGIKDIYDVAGMPTRAGSNVLADAGPAARDSAPVAMLRRAGALIVGKTATTEFASADPARTRNPWNLEHTPGGSSSGSAAAVAAGMVPAAMGSQTAGSILRPASFCGVVGFKPSFGRIPRDGVLPFAWTLDTMGPLTRTVADARLLLRSLTPSTWSLPDLETSPFGSHGPRVGFVPRLFQDRLDRSMRDMLSAAATRFQSAGAIVEEVALPADFETVLHAQHLIMITEAAAFHQRAFPGKLNLYGPRIRRMVEIGALVPATSYLNAQRVRRDLFDRISPLLARYDALLMPAAAGRAPESLDSTGDPAFNAPWTMFGTPAITLPGGNAVNGLPLGLQLVGMPGADEALLDVAEWCEQALGVAPPPPAFA